MNFCVYDKSLESKEKFRLFKMAQKFYLAYGLLFDLNLGTREGPKRAEVTL